MHLVSSPSLWKTRVATAATAVVRRIKNAPSPSSPSSSSCSSSPSPYLWRWSESGKSSLFFSTTTTTAVEPSKKSRSHGSVALWGNGDYGRLGHGSCASYSIPKFCDSLKDISIRQVACGGAHTVIVSEDGRVFTTGLNDFGQLGIDSKAVPFTDSPCHVKDLPPIRFVSAGHYHTICLSFDGEVYAFGKNDNGQLGLGSRGKKFLAVKPERVRALDGVGISSVACGSVHSMALTANGELLTWGCGDNGRLGHGPAPIYLRLRRNVDESSPRLVRSLQDVKICSLSGGLMHSACVDDNGILFTFGYGRFYQLGLGHERDVPVPTPVRISHDATRVSQTVTTVSCGGMHTLAVAENGDVYAWGANEHGCLGLGIESQPNYSGVPRQVASFKDQIVTQVACGWKHCAAVTRDGYLYTWGWGGSMGGFSGEGESSGGQLGHDNEFDYPEPTLVQHGVLGVLGEGGGGRGGRGVAGKNKALGEVEVDGSDKPVWVVVQISCGFNHTAVVVEEKMM